MKENIKDKVVIITGASSGLGEATALYLAQYGAIVVAVARRKDRLESLVKRIGSQGGKALAIVCDVTKRAEKLPVDILVNNAGIVPENRLFPMASPDEMERVFSVNFFAAMRLTQSVSKMMLRRKSGTIINMTSIAALDGEPAQVEYAASKAALVGATKKLASELGQCGIRVNAIAPGVTETDMIASMQTELREKMTSDTILKRLAKPEEIADVAVFLASDLSRYMTGQVLRVDGGMRR